MEFFEYSNYAQQIIGQFNGSTPDWVYFLIGGLCFAIIYIFRSVGLYVIASHEGIKNKWMAFIPFFSTYYIGVCGRKNRFFNIDTRIVGIIAAVFEFCLVGLYILDIVAAALVDPYLLYATDYYEMGGQQYSLTTVSLDMQALLAADPSLGWAGWCFNYLSVYIISWLNFLYMLVMVVLLNCFFQTYSTRRYFLFTITSVLFPVQGILIFAVRNNKGVNYGEYMRSVQERMYRQYRQQNFEQDPYNQNPYSRNGYGAPPDGSNPYRTHSAPPQQGNTDDPFSEFGNSEGSGGDPFDEFKN